MNNFCANLSLLFTEVPLIERFTAAKKAGFKAVEIQFPYEIPLAELVELQQRTQLKIVLINVPAGDLMTGGEGLACVPNKQDEFDTALALCLEYAQALNVSVVNVLPGRCKNTEQLPLYKKTLIGNLNKAATALSEINIRCTFEAINTIDMPNFVVSRVRQMNDVLSEVNNKSTHNNLFMQYDIYHMAMMGENIIDTLKDNMHRIGHIQFADMPGRGEPYSGELDWKGIFACIEESGYDGWLGAEYRPSGVTVDSFGWFDRLD